MRSTLSTLAFLAICQQVAVAQGAPFLLVDASQRQGPFSAWPAGVSIDKASRLALGLGAAQKVFVKPPGDLDNFPPAAQAATGIPDFSLAAILPMADFPAAAAADIEVIDAMATDAFRINDIDNNGWVMPVNGFWAAIMVSIKSNESTLTPSHFTTAEPDNGSLIASHIFLGSDNISPFALGRTFLEMDHVDFGTEVPLEINAFDIGIGLITANPSSANDSTFSFVASSTDFYFSVSKEWAALDIPFVDDNGVLKTGDPAAIYVVHWNNGWSVPDLFLSRAELGLVAKGETDPVTGVNGDNEDIDALIVSTPIENQIIFSTQWEPHRHQLLWSKGTNWHLPLRDSEGVLVERRLGVGEDDDIDAACEEDPEMVNELTPEGGVPVKPLPAPADLSVIGISTAREEVIVNNTPAWTYHFETTFEPNPNADTYLILRLRANGDTGPGWLFDSEIIPQNVGRYETSLTLGVGAYTDDVTIEATLFDQSLQLIARSSLSAFEY